MIPLLGLFAVKIPVEVGVAIATGAFGLGTAVANGYFSHKETKARIDADRKNAIIQAGIGLAGAAITFAANKISADKK